MHTIQEGWTIFIDLGILFQIHKHQKKFFFFCHGTWRMGCGILVPGSGIKPVPPAVEAQNPDYQTTREVPASDLER